MRGAWLVPWLLLVAGCTGAPATANLTATAPAATCVTSHLSVDRTDLHAGEKTQIALTLVNCGDAPAALGLAPCGGPSLGIAGFGIRGWRFIEGDDVPRPTGSPTAGACPPTPLVPAGGSRVLRWSWDGHVRMPIEPCASADCQPLAPWPAGNVSVVLDTQPQQLVVVAWTPAPPCARLGLAADRARLAPGENATLDVTLENCGEDAIALAHDAGCFGPAALEVDLTRGNLTWTFPAPDRTPYRETMPMSAGHCIGSMGIARAVVPPGGTFRERYAWNGSVSEPGLCGAPDAYCARDRPADPGTYALVAVAWPNQDSTREARSETAQIAWTG
ncbi:MAG: hypothetical protein QOE90_1430 [Thermoplasmata archaeon]|nr:hypothetical protein [Thermoplasmata archaeon]